MKIKEEKTIEYLKRNKQKFKKNNMYAKKIYTIRQIERFFFEIIFICVCVCIPFLGWGVLAAYNSDRKRSIRLNFKNIFN